MAASDLLFGAGGVIERNGWIQDDYVDYATDLSGVPRDVKACRVCPRAAIAIAHGQHPLFAVEWPMYCDLVPELVDDPESAAALANEAELAAYAEITEAERVLARYIREELRYDALGDGASDGEVIEFWADEHDRTLPEVIGALNAAGEYAKAGRP